MTIKYPYLPENREIKYVPGDNYFMLEAKRAQEELSTDKSHPTGAVVVKDGKIIGRWGNKSALTNPKLIELHRKGLCTRKVLKIKTGTKYWLCPGCSSCRYHAEFGAVKEVMKKGDSPKGADLYLYGHWWCCKPCWDKMIEGGIKDVYLLDNADKLFK